MSLLAAEVTPLFHEFSGQLYFLFLTKCPFMPFAPFFLQFGRVGLFLTERQVLSTLWIPVLGRSRVWQDLAPLWLAFPPLTETVS